MQYCHVIQEVTWLFYAFLLSKTGYWYKGPEAVVGEFFIKSDVQHEGLGTTFMNALKKKAKENFISSIVLQTQKSNYAYDFYIKNGFIEDNNSVFLFNDIS